MESRTQHNFTMMWQTASKSMTCYARWSNKCIRPCRAVFAHPAKKAQQTGWIGPCKKSSATALWTLWTPKRQRGELCELCLESMFGGSDVGTPEPTSGNGGWPMRRSSAHVYGTEDAGYNPKKAAASFGRLG